MVDHVTELARRPEPNPDSRSGSLAKLLAIRLASSIVSTLAMLAP